MFTKIYLVLFGILLLLSNNLYSQWTVNFSLGHAYDDNAFRSPNPESANISTIDFGIQKIFSKISMSYLGGYTSFNESSVRNNYWHQLALFGELKSLQWGVYAEQRLNKSDYELHNFDMYTAYLNYTFTNWGAHFFWASDVTYNNYPNLEQVNNLKVSSTLRLNKSFETRTTFISGLAFFYKNYTSSVTTIDSSVITGGGGQGHGTGGGGDSYSSASVIELEAPSVSQIQGWVRLAQSITSTTGLAVQYKKSILIEGSSRNVGLSFNYDEESQLFDDHMGFESSSVGCEITQLLPMGFIAKGSFYYTEKDYSTQGIFVDFENFDELILRYDINKTAGITIQKNFFVLNTVLSMDVAFHWMDNSSNSYRYNYTNQYSSIGLSIQL